MVNGFVDLPRLALLVRVDGAHTPGLAMLDPFGDSSTEIRILWAVVPFMLCMKGNGYRRGIIPQCSPKRSNSLGLVGMVLRVLLQRHRSTSGLLYLNQYLTSCVK
jgi:hypothetical protein